jgi:20S proteasome alpha/beta subunit
MIAIKPHPVSQIPAAFKEEAMTIALGILAQDGVVIAADTQQSYPGYWKVDQGKIDGRSRSTIGGGSHTSGLIISGAGDGGYADALSQEIRSTILDSDKVEAAESRLRETVHQFHMNHVAPFAAEREPPAVRMVIGARGEDEFALWSTERSTVTRHLRFAAVGIGDAYARSLLRETASQTLTVDQATTLAAYVIYRTKEFIDGCGKLTDVVYLKKDGRLGGGLEMISTDRIRELEASFRKYCEDVEPAALHYIIGGGEVEIDPICDALRNLKASIARTGAQKALAQQ